MGERGEGKWQEISWDEAFDICETRMREIADKWGPESMVFSQGTGRDAGGAVSLLAYSYGSPNWTMFGLSGHSCFTPQLSAGYVTQGEFTFPDAAQFFPERYESPDYVSPKCTVVWGCSVNRGCVNHYWSDHWFIDLMRQGAKVIVIDPRETWMATRADLFLQIRPGTDNALALAMLNVVVTEDLVDHAFIDEWCHGYDQAGRAGGTVHAGVGGAHHLDTGGEDPAGRPDVRETAPPASRSAVRWRAFPKATRPS